VDEPTRPYDRLSRRTDTAPVLWINPAQVAYVEPRIVRRGRDDEVCG
jgi:hypothetical protein